MNCPIASASMPCSAVQSFLSSLFNVLPGKSVESHVTTMGLARVGRVNLITAENSLFTILIRTQITLPCRFSN